MNRKAKGTRNENKYKKILENNGYYVTRAAGSLGMWDLIAVQTAEFIPETNEKTNGFVVFSQVKTNSLPAKKEMDTLIKFETASPDIIKELVIFKDGTKEVFIVILPMNNTEITDVESYLTQLKQAKEWLKKGVKNETNI